jgi:hypothetical protein
VAAVRKASRNNDRLGEAMRTKIPSGQAKLSAWLATALLCCAWVFGQQPDATPAQSGQNSATQTPAALPDAPAATPPDGSGNTGQPGDAASSSFSSSAPPPPRYWTSNDPNAQVTVLENTPLRVLTTAPISTRGTHEGESLLFTLNEDVIVDGVLIIPRGAMLRGSIVESKKAGKLSGSADLILKLDSLDLGGRSYPLYTYEFKAEGMSKSRPTEKKIAGGAVIGAIAGAALDASEKGTTAVGELAGAGTGAVLGAGVGTAVAAATSGPVLAIPAESQIDFYLASPISVVPASEKEAARLAEGLHAGGPVLYVRGETP